MREFWDKHSLSIVLWGVGVPVLMVGMTLTEGEGMWWDVWSGVAFLLLGNAVLFTGAAWFREINKPEDRV
jgi:hypothetical protein